MHTRPTTVRPRALAAAALALLLPLATACSSDASGSADGDRVVLRVGELGAAPITQEIFAHLGLDQDLPYDIEWKQFVNAGPEYVEAAGVGAVDVGVTADTPLIFADAAGAGLQAVAVIGVVDPLENSNNAIVVPEDSDIESLEDLKGARVAFQEGTIMQYHVIKALESVGLTLDDIEPVNLPTVDGPTALAGGDVDALATLLIYWAQVEGEGARAIATGAGHIAGNSFISARTEALEDPATAAAIEDLIGRYAELEEWQAENPQEWAEFYADLTGLPVEVVRAGEDRADEVVGPITAEVIAAQQDQSDVYFEVGVLQERQDVTAQFDPRFNGLFGAPTDLAELTGD
ncbi:ABC transporter substrate-binding protein [Nocardiopsis protaetiae]|uniref:ABC transporter substrate-binding protein n=2 Tax=Nocardiopsidaceae TaxID=83676 RepID=UPI00387AD3D1